MANAPAGRTRRAGWDSLRTLCSLAGAGGWQQRNERGSSSGGTFSLSRAAKSARAEQQRERGGTAANYEEELPATAAPPFYSRRATCYLPFSTYHPATCKLGGCCCLATWEFSHLSEDFYCCCYLRHRCCLPAQAHCLQGCWPCISGQAAFRSLSLSLEETGGCCSLENIPMSGRASYVSLWYGGGGLSGRLSLFVHEQGTSFTFHLEYRFSFSIFSKFFYIWYIFLYNLYIFCTYTFLFYILFYIYI